MFGRRQETHWEDSSQKVSTFHVEILPLLIQQLNTLGPLGRGRMVQGERKLQLERELVCQSAADREVPLSDGHMPERG